MKPQFSYTIFLTLALAGLSLTSCKKEEGCTDPTATNYNADAEVDDGSCAYEFSIDFRFSHEVDGETLEFNKKQYTTKKGNPYSVTRLRYLISDIVLHQADGSQETIEGYHFVRIAPNTTVDYPNSSDNPTFTFDPGLSVDEATTFDKISFVFGFTPEDNVDGAYNELNQASWAWPDMLGGGYHFLQLEGNYDSTSTEERPYNMHMGTARDTSGGSTSYVDNHFEVDLEKSFTVQGNTTIELVMNVNQWYEKPPASLDEGNGQDWDMRDWPKAVMPNFEAQRTMHDNGKDVFSIGTVE